MRRCRSPRDQLAFVKLRDGADHSVRQSTPHIHCEFDSPREADWRVRPGLDQGAGAVDLGVPPRVSEYVKDHRGRSGDHSLNVNDVAKIGHILKVPQVRRADLSQKTAGINVERVTTLTT